MAEPKRTFPMLPVAHWWALRKKFKQSIPGVITDNYLATVLKMETNSARANVLPFLKVLGIIDEDGKPKERARLWRDDEHYPEVCQAILKEVYPKELLDAAPDPSFNRDAAQRWFAHSTGGGEAACRRMATLYAVLVEANARSEPEPAKTRDVTKSARKVPYRSERKEKPQAPPRSPASNETARNPAEPSPPGININLQVHISADASPDQIEQIFAAMAKHIYRRA